MKYEKGKNWINEIQIQYTETGNLITIVHNDFNYKTSYVFSHDSLTDSIECVREDIFNAIEMLERN